MRVGTRLAALVLALSPTLNDIGALAQSSQSVRDDANAFAAGLAKANQGVADSEATVTANVPGYAGTTTPQSGYMNDPASLDAAKLGAAQSNEAYRLTVDGNFVRPQIPSASVDATLARGNAIDEDPAAIAQGLASGQSGQCVPLPPSTTSAGTFEASCNIGVKVDSGPKSCPITLDHQFTATHAYQCTRLHEKGRVCLQGTASNCTEPDVVDDVIASGCDAYEAAAPTCTTSQTSSLLIRSGSLSRAPTYYETFNVSCSAATSGTVRGSAETVSGVTYAPTFTDLGLAYTYLGSSQNLSQCSGLASDTGCTTPVDVCTDAAPATRSINGVDVTQSCWAWTRTYTCTGTVPANDCSATTIPSGCTFSRDQCLDDPAPADPAQCQVTERIYTCPIPASAAPPQYVCGGDLYCINGDCQPIVREASTEFKDALAGLASLNQASKEFNSLDYTLFKGSGTTCSKPVFGLGNCCGGNGFPLIGACSSADQLLAQQIDKGLTHFVGTYCAKSFLGICTTKRQAYCVFSSKLTRILQEQGRPQLAKTWGTPKSPDCAGFTVDEFSQLDLSVMNFAEIYNDLLDAAKLPDEAATLTDIQARIQAYYAKPPS